MCFFSSAPAPQTQTVQAGPVRNTNAGFARSARATALTAKGIQDTIGTSSLGDTGFGKSVKKPTFLGATASGAY